LVEEDEKKKTAAVKPILARAISGIFK